MQSNKIKNKMKLVIVLLLILLFQGCGTIKKSNCPSFPEIPESVGKKLDEIAKTDREAWEWGNKLLDLCEKLGGNCEY